MIKRTIYQRVRTEVFCERPRKNPVSSPGVIFNIVHAVSCASRSLASLQLKSRSAASSR